MSILWDFLDLSMKFQYNGRIISLNGPKHNAQIEEGNPNQNNKLEKRGLLLQLIEEEQIPWLEKLPQPLLTLLNQYSNVFGEPKGLLLNQSQVHAITMLPNTPPVL